MLIFKFSLVWYCSCLYFADKLLEFNKKELEDFQNQIFEFELTKNLAVTNFSSPCLLHNFINYSFHLLQDNVNWKGFNGQSFAANR